jgi:hypothetical protein
MLTQQVLSKRGLGQGIYLALMIATITAEIRAQKAPKGTEADFLVLRTDRVTEWVSRGQSTRLDCSIVGLGNTAQINCTSSTSASTNGMGTPPLVYQVALVVGSNKVGYIISCGGAVLRRIGCEPLTSGQSLHGFIEGGRLSLEVGSKTKGYSVVTSAYFGSANPDNGPATCSRPARLTHQGRGQLLAASE